MNFKPSTLLTIVTESLLEKELTELFKARQISGWTIVAARGNGSHGEKHGTFDANENIRIEIVADPKILEDLAQHIQEKFAKDYALVQWSVAAQILQTDN